MKMAAIDVHKKVLMVVVIETTSPEEKPERRRFTTLPGAPSRLSSWLRAQDVQEAVMESTAQYWRTVWLELEPHILLHLAHAFSNRAPRGRKHDFKDAERLVRRLFADELILSFVPGMGEVYRVKDTRLDRTVVIKVLPARLSSDPELKQRLEREAGAISALQHPNICTLHDIGAQNGVHFLVME